LSPSTSADYAAYIRDAMTSVGKDVGPVQHLRDGWNRCNPNTTTSKYWDTRRRRLYRSCCTRLSRGTVLCDKESSKHPHDVSPDPKRTIYGNTTPHCSPCDSWRAFSSSNPARTKESRSGRSSRTRYWRRELHRPSGQPALLHSLEPYDYSLNG
jgi:hypothetical protein